MGPETKGGPRARVARRLSCLFDLPPFGMLLLQHRTIQQIREQEQEHSVTFLFLIAPHFLTELSKSRPKGASDKRLETNLGYVQRMF